MENNILLDILARIGIISLANSKLRMKQNPMNALCNPCCWFYLNEEIEILRFILRCGVDIDSYEREYI